eukprot:gnl/Chilomastix_cuspidata/2738.p1 GENE.gnl/Chilomastix_cuspidata/2738~~gnl/Chilomastix_cuspidata/2738.p1  ORF type:complete len:294 (-),score=105.23 gnl/Chilomastix_cuspidata/2738:43-924(-)
MPSREIECMARLNHPCVIRLQQSFFTRSAFSFPSELAGLGERRPVFQVSAQLTRNLLMPVYDCSLHDVLKLNPGGVPEDFARAVCYQLLLAVAHAHAAGVMHRDIKPANVLLKVKTCEVVLADWGSAKPIAAPSTPGMGALAYRAPELLLGDSNYAEKADIWSVGAVLVQLLTGEPLTVGSSEREALADVFAKLGPAPPPEQIGVAGSLRGCERLLCTLCDRKRAQEFKRTLLRRGPLGALALRMLEIAPPRRISASAAVFSQCFRAERDGTGAAPRGVSGPLDALFRPGAVH